MSTPATSPAEKSHIAVTQNDLNGSVYIRPRTDVNFLNYLAQSVALSTDRELKRWSRCSASNIFPVAGLRQVTTVAAS